MSYTPQPEVNAEIAHAREQELEAKAARYAELHPDGETKPGLVKRLIARLRRS